MKSKDTLETWKTRIARGQIPLLLYLYGEDEGQISSFVELIRHRCLAGAILEFNLNLFDAREVAMGQILDTARTLPVLSPWRVVLVRNASTFSPGDWEKALPLLQEPSPSTCLIFRGEKLPGSQKVQQALRAKGAILEFRPRTPVQAEVWVKERFRQAGKRIPPLAVAALVERVGTREGDLAEEIQKLLAYVREADTIEEEDVCQVAAEARTHRIFDLTDAITEHRTVDALKILQRLLEDGASPLALLGMLARQVRLLWIARDALRIGEKGSRWKSRLSVPAFLQQRLLRQAQSWHESDLQSALEGLVRIDQSLKGGRLPAEVLLDRWVLSLAKPKAAGQRQDPRQGRR